MHQAHLMISGFVQGIGYRLFVQHQATKLGIHGFVKNLPGGKVEVLAQGEKNALEALIRQCDIGPRGAKVENIDIVWNTALKPFSSFTLLK